MLLDKALKDCRYLFTSWRVWVLDRYFPGVPLIKAMLETGTHVLIRVRDSITLRWAGDFLPDWPRSPSRMVSCRSVTLRFRPFAIDNTYLSPRWHTPLSRTRLPMRIRSAAESGFCW